MFRLLPHYHRSHQETVVPSQSQDSLSPLESSSYNGALEEHKVWQTQPFRAGIVAGFSNLEEEASRGWGWGVGPNPLECGMVHLLLPPGGSRQAHCFLGLATGLECEVGQIDAGKDGWKAV